MPSDDLILNALDVIEIRSDTDLIITSNSQIKLRTTNILVNYIPLDVYIRKLLSPVIALSGVTSHSNVHSDYGATLTNITGLDQLDNDDEDTEMDIDTVFCRGNFADSSYVDANIEHYINISAASNIYFKHESFDDNILFDEYNRASSLYSLQTLKDYIYLIVNGTRRPGTLLPSLFNPIDYRNNLDHLGSFSGRKVICKKITTNQTELRDFEPILTFDSKTAINFYTDTSSNAGSMAIGSKIYFGNDASSGTDTSLDQLIYDQRSVGLAIAANFTPGLDIIMDVTTITETPRTGFPYDIMFNIYEHPDVYDPVLYPTLLENYMAIPSGSANTFEVPNVLLDTDVPSMPDFTFTNLEPGKFYTVVARTTNLETNTVSYVFVDPPNQPTIKHVYEITVTVIDEETIKIQFRGHETVVSDWSTPGKQIKFSISVDGYSGEITTALRQNLSVVDTTFKTYDLSLSSIPSYGNILRVSSFQTVRKTINIISNHVEVGSTFEMSTAAPLTPFTFNAPRNPPYLSIDYVNKRLTWSHNNDANDRLKNIYFELYKGVTKIQDNSSKIYYGIGTNSVGSWTVKAKNAYGRLSGVSNSVNIVSPSFNVGSITSIGNKTFNIGISNIYANGTHTLSGTNLTSTSSSVSITTISLSARSYTFNIRLTDQVGLTTDRTSSTINIKSPTVSLSSSVFEYSGTPLRYYVTIAVYNQNVLWDIHNTPLPSSLGGTYYSISGNNVYFTFRSNDLGGNKLTAVTIKDTYGYEANTSKSIHLSVTFSYNPSQTISVSGKTVSFTSGLTSYKWHRGDGSIISTGQSLTLTNSNFGAIYCTAIQTNNEGFIRTITSETITNIEPSIHSNSFTGLRFTDVNYTPTDDYVLGPDTNIKTIGSVSVIQLRYGTGLPIWTYQGDGNYTLFGTFLNSYGVEKQIDIGIFDFAIPSDPVINESLTNNPANKTTNSINVYFSLESHGSSSMTSFKIEYKLSGTSSFTTATTLTPSPYDILGLNHYENYDIKITKTYPGYTMDDTVYTIRTNLGTLPSHNIGISSEYRYDAHGIYEIQFSWTSGNDGNPAETLQETRVYYRQGGGDEYINDHIPSLPGDYVVVTNGVNYVGSFLEASYNFRFVKMYNKYNLVIASDNIPFTFIELIPSFAYITMVDCNDTNSTQESYRITYEHDTQTAFHKLQIWNFFGENTPTSEVTLVNDTSTYMKVYETYTYYSERTINIIIPFYNNPPTFYIRVLTPSLQSYSQSAIQIVRLRSAVIYYATDEYRDVGGLMIGSDDIETNNNVTWLYKSNENAYEPIILRQDITYTYTQIILIISDNPPLNIGNSILKLKRRRFFNNIETFSNPVNLLRGCTEPRNLFLDKDHNNFLRVTFTIPLYLGDFNHRDLKYTIRWYYYTPFYLSHRSGFHINSTFLEANEFFPPLDDSTSYTFTSQQYTPNSLQYAGRTDLAYAVLVNVAVSDGDRWFPFGNAGFTGDYALKLYHEL